MLPCTDITLKARIERILPYPEELKTWGDHLKTKRLDLDLTQREVAARIEVSENSVYLWESNRTSVRVFLIPKVIDFLGYAPYSRPQSFGEWVVMCRRAWGLSRKHFAKAIMVDESTLWKWESGRRIPKEKYRWIIKASFDK